MSRKKLQRQTHERHRKQIFRSITQKNVNQFDTIQKIKGMNHQQANDLPMRELSWQRLPSGSVVELIDGRAQP